MGQKINPIGLRLGVNRTWDSRWFSSKGEYGKLLHEDMKIRETLMKGLKQAAISKIVIERPHKKARINIHSARPGVVIGKKGADIEKLRKQVAKLTSSEVAINIVEVRKPEIDATLVAESIAQQLERRVAFRRAMKRAVQSAMRLGAEGIRINCSGRLGGAEIARLEWYRPRAAAHLARRRRLWRRHRPHGLRHLRHQSLDLQGRNSRARSHGPRQASGRGRPFLDPSSAARAARARPRARSRSGLTSALAKVHDHDAA
jgi:small subunit ribosomal protein S3